MNKQLKIICLVIFSFTIPIGCYNTIIEEKTVIPEEYYAIFTPFMESVELRSTDGSVFNLVSDHAELRCITGLDTEYRSSSALINSLYSEWEEYTQYIVSDFFKLDLMILPGSRPMPGYYKYKIVYRFHTSQISTEFEIYLDDAIGETFLENSLVKLNSGDTAWLWVNLSEGIIWYKNGELDVHNPQVLK